jgi:SAM-dependent methyltransferase
MQIDCQPTVRMPQTTRVCWASARAQSVWEPRLNKIVQAWIDIEWRSVAAQIRACALIWVSPRDLASLIPSWKESRLSAVQVRLEDARSPAEPTSPVFRQIGDRMGVAVGALDSIASLQEAWASGNHKRLGSLLGYPGCCRSFFHDVWIDRRWTDTMWAMAKGPTTVPGDHFQRIDSRGGDGILTNILWRCLGVRAVPHLPCSFDCRPSAEMGGRFLALGAEAGFGDEMGWLREILSWPVEWSALHGIAEIKTPVLKISTHTDPTSDRLVLQYTGLGYPDEGATGIHFPYRKSAKTALTRSRSFQSGLAHGTRAATILAPRARLNGFASEDVMDRYHEPLVAVARSSMPTSGGGVIDLGCGTGILLSKICSGNAAIPFGIDANPVVIAHARERLRSESANFFVGDLFDTALWDADQRHYALALIMLGRLGEAPHDVAEALMTRLKERAAVILGYTYDSSRRDAAAAIAREFEFELIQSALDDVFIAAWTQKSGAFSSVSKDAKSEQEHEYDNESRQKH